MLPNSLLVAVLVHLLDVVAVANARGPDQVQVALAVAPLAQVEVGHADARGAAAHGQEVREGLVGDEAQAVVAAGLQRLAHEGRELLGGGEGDVGGEEEGRLVDLVVARVAALAAGAGEHAAEGLPAVLEEIPELGHHVERLAELGLQRRLPQRHLQTLGVAHHPDLGDLGHALERGHHMGDQRPSLELEVGLALSPDGLRRPEVAGGDDGGNSHGPGGPRGGGLAESTQLRRPMRGAPLTVGQRASARCTMPP